MPKGKKLYPMLIVELTKISWIASDFIKGKLNTFTEKQKCDRCIDSVAQTIHFYLYFFSLKFEWDLSQNVLHKSPKVKICFFKDLSYLNWSFYIYIIFKDIKICTIDVKKNAAWI